MATPHHLRQVLTEDLFTFWPHITLQSHSQTPLIATVGHRPMDGSCMMQGYLTRPQHKVNCNTFINIFDGPCIPFTVFQTHG